MARLGRTFIGWDQRGIPLVKRASASGGPASAAASITVTAGATAGLSIDGGTASGSVTVTASASGGAAIPGGSGGGAVTVTGGVSAATITLVGTAAAAITVTAGGGSPSVGAIGTAAGSVTITGTADGQYALPGGMAAAVVEITAAATVDYGVIMWRFIPPSTPWQPAQWKTNPLLRFKVGPPMGVTVIVHPDNTITEVQGPSNDDLLDPTLTCFWGGREYLVDFAMASLLFGAGYSLTEVTSSGLLPPGAYGDGTYGEGTYGA